MYYIYLLHSPCLQKTYVGQTNDLESRAKKHNAGRVRSSKAYRPWQLGYFDEYETRDEAMKRKKWFKSEAGRKRIGELLSGREGESTALSDPDQ